MALVWRISMSWMSVSSGRQALIQVVASSKVVKGPWRVRLVLSSVQLPWGSVL